MADKEETGEQILSKTIDLANQIIIDLESESGVQILSSSELEFLKTKVDWLVFLKKKVFELDNSGYFTATLLPILIHWHRKGVIFMRNQEGSLSELERSEYQVTRMIGLLGLILMHHGYMLSPPDPYCEYGDYLVLLLRFVGLRELGRTVASLLELLREGNEQDQLIGVMAIGIFAQRPGIADQLVANGVMIEFVKILNEGPMLLQAEVTHVIYKIIKKDPTVSDKWPLDDVVGSLKLRYVATLEKIFWDSTKKERVEKSSIEEHFQLPRKDSSSVNSRMRKMDHKLLLVLAQHKSVPASDIMKWMDVVNFSLYFLGIEESVLTIEGQVRESLLLQMLREGSVLDKFISVTAVGGIALESRRIEHLVEAGVAVELGKILKEGPMALQYEVAHVISLFVDINPTIRDKLPLDSLIASLVRHLQVEVTEDQFQYRVNKATSVLSIVAARHNSNSRKVVANENEGSKLGEKIQLPPDFKARMRVLASNVLKVLAKDNVSVCRIIVEKGAHLCFAVLLQNAGLDVTLASAAALMEITAVAEKDTDLRRSGFRHNSYALKSVSDQLIRIVEDAWNEINEGQSIQQIISTPELLITSIKAIGNLAATFRDTRPITTLVHLLESDNNEVSKECLAALTKFVCRDYFLHMDHSRAIISSGGLTCIIRLAVDETIGLQKHALLLLCYVSLDTIGNQSDKSKEVLSAINRASRSAKFSKDETVESQLVQQAKRRLV